MKIHEIEKITGLDRASIRYYEREGLLKPERLENGYREYSQDDALILKRIVLLRRLGVSIDSIRQLQKGSGNFPDLISAQAEQLSIRAEDSVRCQKVCQAILNDGAEYFSLDADHYLELLHEIEINDTAPQQQSFQENIPRRIHPWRRYIARWLDMALYMTMINFVIVVILRIRPLPNDLADALIGIGACSLYIPIEALLISRLGTTPGKHIMGIHLEYYQGGLMPFGVALSRSAAVYTKGLGCNIPILTTIKSLISYCKITGRSLLPFLRYDEHSKPEEAPWDNETEIIYRDYFDIKRGVVLFALVALILPMSIVSASDAMKPKYRSSHLTISEFAENYNYYSKLMQENAVDTSYLMSDGSWLPSNTIVMTMNGEAKIPEPFVYETNNGYIESIRYEKRYTDVSFLNPMHARCTVAIATILMSQKGMGYSDFLSIAKQIDETDFTTDGSIKFENIEIQWNIEIMNCKIVDTENSKLLIKDDQSKSSSANIVFVIIIH